MEMDGYPNGFDKYIDRRIEMKMKQIKAQCNCKDYDYHFDSDDYYDDWPSLKKVDFQKQV